MPVSRRPRKARRPVDSNAALAIWVTDQFRIGNCTRAYRDVYHVLISYHLAGGCYPSHQTLADGASCSISTVQGALNHARDVLGCVYWITCKTRDGLRTTNRYILGIPSRPVPPGHGPVWRRATPLGESWGREKVSIKEGFSLWITKGVRLLNRLVAKAGPMAIQPVHEMAGTLQQLAFLLDIDIVYEQQKVA